MFRSQPDLLVSDAEREQVADFLKRHYATGRLTGPELADRVDATYRARRESELVPLIRDLPPLDVPAPARRRRRLPVGGLVATSILVAATIVFLASLPAEMAVLFVAITVPMLTMLAIMVAPVALLLLGVVWLVRALQAPRRHPQF